MAGRHRGVVIGSPLLILAWAIPALPQIPPGFELVRITNDEDHDGSARINVCGQVVFSKRFNQQNLEEEIMLYDNGRTVQITDDEVEDRIPYINNGGIIVWQRQRAFPLLPIIMIYQDRRATEFAEGRTARINNLGHMAWKRPNGLGCRGSDADIFFFDGETTTQITSEDRSNQALWLNDNDEIAWVRFDFCQEPWESDIMLYSGGETVRITDGHVEPQRPNINNHGVLAFESKDENFDRFISIWEQGETRVLTDWGSAPLLNNSGTIAFARWDDETETGNAWVVIDDEFYRIEFDDLITGSQHINDYGEVPVFLNLGQPHTDLAFLRRIRTGDSEFDGDIDHDDLAKLVDCMTGPMWVERTDPGPEDSLCECRFLDINHDGSVDLRDYAIFQENFAKKP